MNSKPLSAGAAILAYLSVSGAIASQPRYRKVARTAACSLRRSSSRMVASSNQGGEFSIAQCERRGTERHELPLDGQADTVALWRVTTDGENDVPFALQKTRLTSGDCYLVRVKQANNEAPRAPAP